MHYFKGPLVLRISLLISPWAVLLPLSPKIDEAGWGLVEGGGGCTVFLSWWGCVGCSGRFPFLPSFLSFFNQKVILNTKWEAAKRHAHTHTCHTLRSHVLQPPSGSEQREFSVLTIPSPPPTLREGQLIPFIFCSG